ncbi:MAG TPA: M48 family metallopeptidase [Verrucomicrobiota bacterium]|nr:peptidase M48 [Verrucomicrobiales bacterium]HRI14297.1 M48 family metallopeptidase [Verrucomicrobiota bacterium]
MSLTEIIPYAATGLILARLGADTALNLLNRRSVRAHASAVPEAFRATVDPQTYSKSVQYTLAKSKFGEISDLWGTAAVLAVLFLGILPATFVWFRSTFGVSAWTDAAWIFAIGVGLSVWSLPMDWWAQFRLEERFGFNTTTARLWWTDHVKGFVLVAVLGYPLLVLILKLVGWMGPSWWIWAWAIFIGFQLMLLVVAPILILPLFNKLTPLPDGTLRDRLLALARRTGFSAKTLLVMDGSKRSRHSNAFFTGFGRFRKIVLFDTLIGQLHEPELEAVLAHEVGHYKRGHIPQRLAVSAIMTLAGFWIIAWLMQQSWFAGAFGFAPDAGLAPALLLFGLLGGTILFWVSPLSNCWSRRHEYEADAFARRTMGSAEPLVGALRKLSEKNLSNLTPHPWFSAWHYSHPTLLEREAALAADRRPNAQA